MPWTVLLRLIVRGANDTRKIERACRLGSHRAPRGRHGTLYWIVRFDGATHLGWLVQR
jgi:hypothetical protein